MQTVKDIKSENSEVFATRSKQVANSVKKAWCAYFDPQKTTFGKPSRCLHCCTNNNTHAYDPNMLDRECAKHHIIDGSLPSFEEALKRGLM